MLKNARPIIVEADKCPIDKMVEVKSQEGLAPRAIISRGCYNKLIATCDEFKAGYCQVQLIWKESEEYPKTIMELEGPCFNNVSSSKDPEYKCYYIVKNVSAIDIQYSKAEGPETQYFLLEGEE